jgi:plasmid stability protein
VREEWDVVVIATRSGAAAVRLCYTETVKNVTVAVPDEVYRAARIHAAQTGSSVSALVTEYLTALSEREARFARLEAQQQHVQSQITHFRAGDRLSRDATHDRAVR